MPLKDFSQRSFFDPETISPGILTPGTLPWMLSQLGESLVPRFLAAEWRGAGPLGREGWPSRILMDLCLLRWLDGGMSRLGACNRLKTDLVWRAAAGLPANDEAPHEKTVREFEAWLIERTPSCDLPRYMVVLQRVVHLFESEAPAERIWMEDSTPMLCFGALRGTVRLLGDGLRGLVRRWARVTRTSAKRLAQDLDVRWLNARSIKGGLDIDWRDQDARHSVVDRLARDVLRVVGELQSRMYEVAPHHQLALHQRCAALLKVIEDDLVGDDCGRLVIAIHKHHDKLDRIVSITDPEARSGGKSRKQKFKGFKLSVLGDLVSGLIAAVTVVAGNAGDGPPGHELLRRAKAMGVRIRRLLADSAYGGTADRLVVSSMGIELVAPPQKVQIKKDCALQKHLFDIDFERERATCPAGVATETHSLVRLNGEQVTQYEWPHATCGACRLRQDCVPKLKTGPKKRGQQPKGRRLKLHADEETLRAARGAWTDPALRQEYRRRGEGERLIARMVQFGARQARAFGLAAANLQAHCVAIAANLALLAKLLADRSAPVRADPLPLFQDSG